MLNGVGVIIARFQVPELTSNHKALIKHVSSRHDDVLVLLGCGAPSKRNPLPFRLREQMVNEQGLAITVLPIQDGPSDEEWSQRVDGIISTIYPFRSVTIYGGPGSFIPHYKGHFTTEEVASFDGESGNELRHEVLESQGYGQDFRRGVIWSQMARFDRAYPVVDIAIYDRDADAFLMARKPVEANTTGYRFIGGFVDPRDSSLEDAAIRETKEETGATISAPTYIGSVRIDDWRYRGSGDGIISSVFLADFVPTLDRVKPNDDIITLRWVPRCNLTYEVLPVHEGVANLVLEKFRR
jgi:bifunctional NMN adenylyltransferase/nudix hydrolase